jgi:hypothetical protein
MVGDNKDRLDDVGAAREDQWARQRDAELVDKLRKRLGKVACPNCKQFLVPKTEGGVAMLSCPQGHGAWLDAAALKTVLEAQK